MGVLAAIGRSGAGGSIPPASARKLSQLVKFYAFGKGHDLQHGHTQTLYQLGDRRPSGIPVARLQARDPSRIVTRLEGQLFLRQSLPFADLTKGLSKGGMSRGRVGHCREAKPQRASQSMAGSSSRSDKREGLRSGRAPRMVSAQAPQTVPRTTKSPGGKSRASNNVKI